MKEKSSSFDRAKFYSSLWEIDGFTIENDH